MPAVSLEVEEFLPHEAMIQRPQLRIESVLEKE
jgi:hypothetical protein